MLVKREGSEERLSMPRIIFRLCLVLLGIFLTLVVVEISVRFYLAETQIISDKDCRREDKLLHHSLIPNTSCRSRTSEWDIKFKVNSLGLRDNEYSLEKPKGIFRILMLGDSFVEGYGVHSDATFSKILERKLNSNGEKIEVINAGVTGYSPILEYLYLKNYGLALSPDLVVMNFSMTDFYDELAFKNKLLISEEELDKTGEKVGRIWKEEKLFQEEIPATTWIPFIPKELKWWLHKNLLSYDFFILQLKKYFNPEVYKDNILKFTIGDIYTDQFAITRNNIKASDYQFLLENAQKYILKTKELLDKEKLAFLLVIIPFGHQVNGQEWAEGRKLWDFKKEETYSSKCISDLYSASQENKISALNLLPFFREATNNTSLHYYYPYDGHWNSDGHKLAAEEIYNFLVSQRVEIVL